MKLAAAFLAATVWLAGTGIADARPCPRPRPSTSAARQARASRTSCEAKARAAANASGHPANSRAWWGVYDDVLAGCLANPMQAAA